MNKHELRAAIRAKKRAMTEEEILRQSAILAGKLKCEPLYRDAEAMYFYLPYNQEVRTWPMIEAAWAAGKTVAVPRIRGEEMRFHRIDPDTPISPGSFGIPEPPEEAPVVEIPGAPVLLPGLAFDREGGRVGYGGGYYDKYLSAHPGHPTVALCYDFQLLPHVPMQEHDIRVDRVICAGQEDL